MRRPTLLLALLLLAVLAAMAAKTLLIELPPVRAGNAPGEFDAHRARARLAIVLGDQRPHPSDTPANDAVRRRIVAQLQALGIAPIVRDQVACNELYKARGVSCARVRNVIAILGPATGKALLLNAHYDSTPVGPGAADDGIGVATLLEVGSILKSQPLKRPVILLFNEGEELGLIGARAFLGDPLSRDVDSLVNLEARGVRGPVNMFETSRPNGGAIGLFSRAVRHPVANSLSTDVYRLMPNYTDVNSFSERGWLALNLAPIGNETRYHSAGDELAALDLRTLQHMGDQTLALATSLANGKPRGGGERIFMDVAGRALITLPLAVGVVLLVGLLVAFGWLAWKRGRIGRGLAVVLGTLAGSSALSWMAIALIGLARPGMLWRAHPLWTNLGSYAAVMVTAVVLIATLGRALDRSQLRASFWLVFLALGGAIGLAAPGGIIFFLFPPLLVLIGIVARRWWKQAERAGSAVAILFLYLTWGAMLALLEELLNSGPMWLFAPLGALLILPVMVEARPLVAATGARRSAVIAGALALVPWAAAAVVPAYSADRQQRFSIEHVTDAATGKALWSVVNDGAPLPPAYRALTDWHRGKLPHSDRMRWLAAARPAPGLAAPSVELLSTVQRDGRRTVTVRLRPNGALAVSLIAPKDSDINAAGVAGFLRPIDQSGEKGRYALSCFGRSCDGLVLRFVTGAAQPMGVIAVGSRPALPASASPLVEARPRAARPQYSPDQAITLSRVWL